MALDFPFFQYGSVLAQTWALFLPTLLLVWLCWRLWRFSLSPLINHNSNNIKELPYWIPFIGHAVSFFRDIDATVDYGRKYFGNTKQTFSITVTGKEMYIMTSPINVAAALRSLQTFEYDSTITGIMERFGISSEAIRVLYTKPTAAFEKSHPDMDPNFGSKTMATLGGVFILKQMSPKEEYHDFEAKFLSEISQRLTWQSFPQKAMIQDTMIDASTCTMSLLQLVRHTIVESTTVAYLGPAILELDASLVDNFLFFDDRIWVFLYQMPRPWASPTLDSMERLRRSIETYLDLPKNKRPGASWLATKLEAEMKARGLQNKDIAGFLAMIFWAMNTNTWRACFWLCAYVLHDPELLNAIRAETAPYVERISSLSDLHSNLARCKLFSSTYHEVLRLVDSPISLRTLSKPAVSAMGESLPAGARLMIMHRQLMKDVDAWGENADQFDPRRFLGHEDLLKCKSYTPFGGGSMLCPGRFMARGEVMVFVALLIHRFDVLTHGPFPQLDTKSGAGAGILGPKKDVDAVIVVSRKADAL